MLEIIAAVAAFLIVVFVYVCVVVIAAITFPHSIIWLLVAIMGSSAVVSAAVGAIDIIRRLDVFAKRKGE